MITAKEPIEQEMKLVLGTVQLGLNYGINNKTGQPSRRGALAILDKAFAHGIRFFDTAHAYGDAEEIIGEFVSVRNLQDKISVISKFKTNSDQDSIETELKKSLQRLRMSSLDGYLLHNPASIHNGEIIRSLQDCQAKGLVKNIGVSVYNHQDARYAVASGLINYIQIPYSVFDQGLNNTDFFELAQKNNVKIFARSVFLQGLILMKDEEIPAYLFPIKPYLSKFDDIINKYNLSRTAAALLFVYGNKDIDHVVFGADNITQLDKNIAIIKESVNYEECMAELKNKFIGISQDIISPPTWKAASKK